MARDCPSEMAWKDAVLRICVVGCGAVGSLFAANLAQLDDVEVWAYDLAREHVDAINAHGLRLSGAGDVVGARSRDLGRKRAPAVRLRHRRDEGDAHRCRDRSDRARFAGGCVASVQNGIGNEEAIAQHVERVIRGTTFPAGRVARTGSRAVGRQRRHDVRPVRAAAGAPGAGRAPRRRVHPRRDARAPSRTRAARSGAR